MSIHPNDGQEIGAGLIYYRVGHFFWLSDDGMDRLRVNLPKASIQGFGKHLFIEFHKTSYLEGDVVVLRIHRVDGEF